MHQRVFLLVLCLLVVAIAPAALGTVRAEPRVVRAEAIATGLAWPVSFGFAPDGRVLYNERFTGRVMAFTPGGGAPAVVANVSVVTQGEQGLLGLALDSEFAVSPWVYVYYTTFDVGLQRILNRVVRILLDVQPVVETVVEEIPAGTYHNGGILGFAPDGTLFITTGDATNSASAQDPSSLSGKILRVLPGGGIPADNPSPGSPVYSLGHRNVFGLAFHPVTGQAYVSENGPSQDDEINALVPGGNFGWPDVTGAADVPGFVDPVWTYPHVIAPTGLAFCASCGAALWEGDVILGDWNRGILQRIDLVPPDDVAIGTQDLWDFGGQGLLDVEMGPDGHLYASTPDGIYRIWTGDVPSDGPLPTTFLVLLISGVAVAGAVIFGLALLRARRR